MDVFEIQALEVPNDQYHGCPYDIHLYAEFSRGIGEHGTNPNKIIRIIGLSSQGLQFHHHVPLLK